MQTSVAWPDNRAVLEGDLHFESWTEFGLGLQFISPLEAIKDVGVMVKNSRTGPYSFQVSGRTHKTFGLLQLKSVSRVSCCAAI